MRTGDGERLTRQHFGDLLRRPWYMTVLVVVPCAAMVGFAAAQNAPFAIGAPIVLALAILIAGRGWAAGRAKQEVLTGFARRHGLEMRMDPVTTPSWTPLLRAGDERRTEVSLTGAIDGMPVHIAHYTYTEIKRTTDSKGHTRTEREHHHFTIGMTEVHEATDVLPALYLKPDAGLFDFGAGWLNTGDLTRCETESVRFNERYKGWHRREQDPIALRRFLDPSTIDTLANHPMHLGVEMAGGSLLVYMEGHCADSGELQGMVDALAMMRRCALAAARVSEPSPASPGPAAASHPPPA